MTSEADPVVSQQKLGSVAVGASATLFASIVSMVIGMLVNILVARTLGPEIKGRVDLINASGSFAAMVTGLSLASGITFVVAQGQVNLQRLAWQLAGISIVQYLVIWVGLTVLSNTRFASAFIPQEFILWGAFGISILALATILASYGRAFLSGLQKFVSGAMADIITRILTAVATIGALFWAGVDHDKAAVVIIFSIILANYMAFLMTMGLVWPYRNPRENLSKLRRVWQYSIPSYAGNLVQFANYRLDVFLVAYFIGVREVALYGAAVSIAQLLWLPSNAMQSVLFPRISSMTDEQQKAEVAAQVMRLMLILTLFGGVLLALIAPWVVTFLFGPRFAPSLLPLWLILPGIIVFCIANVLCGYIAGIGKPRLNFLIALAGLTATLSIDFALIPKLGMTGAAIASSVSYIISAGLALYFFIRESKLSLMHTLWLTKADVQLAYYTIQRILQKKQSSS